MPHETDFPSDLRILEREYELIREIGQGGMAAVYLARHRKTGQLVAIKAIRARYLDDEDARQRFAREARTVADLDHPNIVRTHAVEQIDDRAIAIIMEHVAGGTVRDRLREYGSLGAEQAEGILRDVASALRYAHARGIVHRDVKPENIFLDAETGRAKLSDFGIARQIEGDAPITLLGAALGTPQYMSPEQIDGQMVDGRSDIYSLGVLGWELLTGRRPWAGESLYGVIYKQKHEDLPRITSVRPRVPANLLFAIEGALVKDRSRRWQTVDEFLHQLTYNPPPVLAQESRAGAAPLGDAPTVRFVRVPVPGVPPADAPMVLDDSTEAAVEPQAGSTAATPGAAPRAGPADDPFAWPDAVADERVAQHAFTGHAGAVQPLEGDEYALPEFGGAGDAGPDARPLSRRVWRAAALLVPLTIVGASLFIMLGGRSGSSAVRGARAEALTSSGGSIAPEGIAAADSAAPRPVPAVHGESDSARAVPDTPPALGASEGDAPPGPSSVMARPRAPVERSRLTSPHGASLATPGRTARPRRDTTAGRQALGDPRGVGDSSARTRMAAVGEEHVPGDSLLASSTRASSVQPGGTSGETVPADPFSPPTSPVTEPATVTVSDVASGSGAARGAARVPSARCRVASTADQRACLDAYIAVGDAPMERAFDALIDEFRRVARVAPDDPDPPSVTRVRIEQNVWLRVRNAECPRQPPAGADPFWAEQQSRCFTEMAASRAGELQEAVRRLRRR